MTDEWATRGFAAGDDVIARGLAPTGLREWFTAKVVGIRKTAWPPLTVKYTSTPDGNTLSLLLPRPTVAHVHHDEVKAVKK